jgi:four helix bundle protein
VQSEKFHPEASLPTTQRFGDLIAWQKARTLVRNVYKAVKGEAVRRDWGFCDQIRRAAVSAMSNIAEGFEKNTQREFHQFLGHARASAGEVRSLLYVGLDVGYLAQLVFDELMSLTDEVCRIIGGLRSAVARRLEPA